MKEIFEQLKNGKNIQLTGAEKSVVRFSVAEFIDAHPKMHEIQMEDEIIPAPKTVRPIRSPYHYSFSYFMKATAFALIMVVSLGGSLTFASERALPGDALYSFKVNVRERAEHLLAFSSEKRALVAQAHIKTRLIEIDALKREKSLDEKNASTVTEALLENTADLKIALNELKDAGEETTTSTLVRTIVPELEAHLATSEETSAQIEAPDPGSEENRTEDTSTPEQPALMKTLIAPEETAGTAEIAPSTSSETESMTDDHEESMRVALSAETIISGALQSAQEVIVTDTEKNEPTEIQDRESIRKVFRDKLKARQIKLDKKLEARKQKRSEEAQKTTETETTSKKINGSQSDETTPSLPVIEKEGEDTAHRDGSAEVQEGLHIELENMPRTLIR